MPSRLSQQIVHAPELAGRSWMNTTEPLSLEALRGKFVLLDFWTFCCINCLHVLDELRPLEKRFEDELVIIGVHSPKFEHERDRAALAAAVERYQVDHPVLDDPELLTWQQYSARAWPTLTLVDPEGFVIFSMAGEGHGPGLTNLLAEQIEVYRSRGSLRTGAAFTPAPTTPSTTLRFPGKGAITPTGTLLVSSSAQHQIVELETDGSTVIRRIGTGARGAADGGPDAAMFSEPQGLLTLPRAVADTVGYDVVIADTVNHQLRGLRLSDGYVKTIAGTGKQWRTKSDERVALRMDMSSPWDVEWFDEKVIIAMAGIHQLWWFDPIAGEAGVYAGTTTEALGDGPLLDAWLAQPSGLSTHDGETLWVADSETSALRYIQGGEIRTAVGTGLFDFGSVDGRAADALMQHPLGVYATSENTVLVADTYNGSIRRYDTLTNEVSTIATGLAEPSDVFQVDGSVFVVESSAHRVAALDSLSPVAPDETVEERYRTERPPITVAPGPVKFNVTFEVPAGQKLDEQFGPPTRLDVTASPASLVTSGAGVSTTFERKLEISGTESRGVLQVIAQAATCDAEGEHPACHLLRQDWGVPIVVANGGATEITLVLHGGVSA